MMVRNEGRNKRVKHVYAYLGRGTTRCAGECDGESLCGSVRVCSGMGDMTENVLGGGGDKYN